jgi:hypothetical protein
MRPDSPSKFQCKTVAVDTTMTTQDVQTKGLFVITSAGVTLTLPAPGAALSGYECLISNNSNNNVTVSCANGFPNNGDSILLAAATSVSLYCTPISGTDYRWVSVGATAS